MTANELRIGNLVYVDKIYYTHKDGEEQIISPEGIYSVWGIILKGFAPNSDSLYLGGNNVIPALLPVTNVKPIPLTEEWLVQFGFKHYYDKQLYYEWA